MLAKTPLNPYSDYPKSQFSNNTTIIPNGIIVVLFIFVQIGGQPMMLQEKHKEFAVKSLRYTFRLSEALARYISAPAVRKVCRT